MSFQERTLAKLTSAARKKIPTGKFALAGRRYPIEDRSHAANALSRVSQFGTASEKATVRSKVHRAFPSMGKRSGLGSTMSRMKKAGVFTRKRA